MRSNDEERREKKKGRGEEVKIERGHAGPRNEEIFSLKIFST